MCNGCLCGSRAQDFTAAAAPRGLKDDDSSGGRPFQHRTTDSTRAERRGGRREEESASRGSLGYAITAQPGFLPTTPRQLGHRARAGGSVGDGRRKPALRGRGRSPERRGLVRAPPSHSLLEYTPQVKLRFRTAAAACLRRVSSWCSRGKSIKCPTAQARK